MVWMAFLHLDLIPEGGLEISSLELMFLKNFYNDFFINRVFTSIFILNEFKDVKLMSCVAKKYLTIFFKTRRYTY